MKRGVKISIAIGILVVIFLVLLFEFTIDGNAIKLFSKSKQNIPSANVSTSTNSNLCSSLFYNLYIFNDSLDDAISNSPLTVMPPSYVDIKSLTLRQIGNQVQFIWEGNGNLENNDEQYYFIVLDTDFNSQTGQSWGGIGGEVKITLSHTATINYFEGINPNPINYLTNIPVVFDENKFYLNIPFNYINSSNFNLYFETSGGTPYYDQGSINKVSLQPQQQKINLIIEADKMVLKNNPSLVAVEKGDKRQLKSFMIKGNTKTHISQNKIIYKISHPVGDRDSRIGNLSEIISINNQGIVKYTQRPGFILVNGLVKECGLTTEKPLIIATGSVYGNPLTDYVIGVFPKNYATRESGQHTFDEMFRNYTNAMRTWNLAYSLSSQMYGNYKPFNENKQIFSMIVSQFEPDNPFACGNMNPLESDPTCYMIPSGTPGYDAPIHEMGHNFGESKGMSTIMYSQYNRIQRGGECIASLPVIYMYKDFTDNPQKYGINRNSYEWKFFSNKLQNDIPYVQQTLPDFENQIRSGQITGYLDDNGQFDRVAILCDFFQIYVYDLTSETNQYKQEVIPRFLGVFSDRELPNYINEKSETYFLAAYSAAVGYDMRDKLRFWGFEIDDEYFDQIYPMLLNEMNSV